ncbi:hypothetical protein K470DRAFT_270701 [Piedraia hortae CBS 480.64]|uniref:F-box domain-containing protein n=1 Tax=Piedraia hortae CBS 480.64 TaxID=1314780 RepID=A0A6A7BZI0_9PEZI|nr:hypothetical protein K470DRAFT_270701 [Piedraia hortae CBS 480.64]
MPSQLVSSPPYLPPELIALIISHLTPRRQPIDSKATKREKVKALLSSTLVSSTFCEFSSAILWRFAPANAIARIPSTRRANHSRKLGRLVIGPVTEPTPPVDDGILFPRPPSFADTATRVHSALHGLPFPRLRTVWDMRYSCDGPFTFDNYLHPELRELELRGEYPPPEELKRVGLRCVKLEKLTFHPLWWTENPNH